MTSTPSHRLRQLAIHFLIWWLFVGSFYAVLFGARAYAVVPVIPITAAWTLLEGGQIDDVLVVASVSVLLLIATTVWALRRPDSTVATSTAHVCVVGYWVQATLLAGISV